MQRGRSNSAAQRARTVGRTPAVRSLLIQAVSFALVVCLAFVLPLLTNWQLSLAAAALLQGVLAASIARWQSMAPWWLPIHFLFPVALLTLSALQLPPWIYLAAFIVFLVLFWSTFRTQVPYYPSSRATWDAVASLLPAGRPVRAIDIGSGFGGLVLHLAARRPESAFTGIELAPLPWALSALRARTRGNAARFVRGDYEGLNLGDFDLVFAYLSPAAMPALWQKACEEMRGGALLVSLEFPIPGHDPDRILEAVDKRPPLFVWKMK